MPNTPCQGCNITTSLLVKVSYPISHTFNMNKIMVVTKIMITVLTDQRHKFMYVRNYLLEKRITYLQCN